MRHDWKTGPLNRHLKKHSYYSFETDFANNFLTPLLLEKKLKISIGNYFEGNLDSMKRSKDDEKEVNTGFECGIGCDKFSSWKEGDIIEAFKFVTKNETIEIVADYMNKPPFNISMTKTKRLLNFIVISTKYQLYC